jgi:ABC-2 type transport system ATP-binding protein
MAREKAVVLTLDRDVEKAPTHAAFEKSELVGDRTVEITYNKDRMNAGEVLATMQGLGLGIVDVTTKEADLEDVFLRLTSNP